MPPAARPESGPPPRAREARAAAVGLLAGLLGGATGLGGAAVAVPLLRAWAGVPHALVGGTSLAAAAVVGATGAGTYAVGGAVSWGTAALVAGAATAAALLGSSLLPRVPGGRLRRGFGAVLLVLALLLALAPETTDPPGGRTAAALALGALAGGASGVLGVGGGSLVVPLLVLALGFDQHRAQGTSLAILVPAGLVGAALHGWLGQVDRRLVAGLALGAAAGAWLGARAALALPPEALRAAFALLLAGLGLRTWRAVRPGASPPRR